MGTNTSSNASKGPAILSAQESHVNDGDENRERGNWNNKSEYMFSLVGFAIGLGNIWRFPYMAYKNGGGAFLIPYFIMLVLCGIPLFFLESAVGQFCSQGPVNIWRAVPLFKGLGFSMVAANIFILIYYSVIVSYALFYLFASFQYPLPWASCSSCTPLEACNVSGVLMTNWTQANITCPSSDKVTVSGASPSEQYWDRVALQRSSGLDETGPVVWHLALCLLLTSLLVAAVLFRGIKSSGKVVYFTATLPYVIILILVVRGVTLEGARDGLDFYIGSKSNFTKLTEAQVWSDATSQTLYSLAISWGGVTTLASYSKFNNNMFMDSVIICLLNHGTSVFAGFAIFSIMGHMSLIYGKPVEDIVSEGFGVAFIAYPDALATFPLSPLWSVMFFLMLFIIGLDSMFAPMEVIITCLCDAFPNTLSHRHGYVSICTCAVIFLLGLPCVTRAGIYWVVLIDQFSSTWVIIFLTIFELIGFCYIYGLNPLIKDIEMMIGKRNACFWWWWRANWLFISPALCLVILIWSLVSFVPPSYGGVPYPDWGLTLGWCISATILLWIPVGMVYMLIKAEGSLLERLKSVCSPSEDWHPFLDIHRGERYSPMTNK